MSPEQIMARHRVAHLFVTIVLIAGAVNAHSGTNSTAPVKVKRSYDRSTSSSSGERDKKDSDVSSDSDSLKVQESGSRDSSSSGSDQNNKWIPKSSAERHGWRRYHRKCTKCPEMTVKWRDPSIKWLCGGYQRARRSFKSACMMKYRNCQDGTMFVKIHSGRCKNDTKRHGDHFMYDYKVVLSGDSTESTNGDSSEVSRSDSSDD